MNISLDTLRGLADRQNIVFNSDRQNVERASARQSIGSLFGTKNAKALNHKTFDEIKNAVLSDPRYFGVREKANELLSKINADKAIKSRDISTMLKSDCNTFIIIIGIAIVIIPFVIEPESIFTSFLFPSLRVFVACIFLPFLVC